MSEVNTVIEGIQFSSKQEAKNLLKDKHGDHSIHPHCRTPQLVNDGRKERRSCIKN